MDFAILFARHCLKYQKCTTGRLLVSQSSWMLTAAQIVSNSIIQMDNSFLNCFRSVKLIWSSSLSSASGTVYISETQGAGFIIWNSKSVLIYHILVSGDDCCPVSHFFCYHSPRWMLVDQYASGTIYLTPLFLHYLSFMMLEESKNKHVLVIYHLLYSMSYLLICLMTISI